MVEFYVRFENEGWYHANKVTIAQYIEALPTFVGYFGEAYLLRDGPLNARGKKDCPYDIRLMLDEDSAFIEIISNGRPVVRDLSALVDYLKANTDINIVDDDGEGPEWFFDGNLS